MSSVGKFYVRALYCFYYVSDLYCDLHYLIGMWDVVCSVVIKTAKGH